MIDVVHMLDNERRSAGELSETGDLVREWSADRSECRITYLDGCPEDVADIVEREVAHANRYSYDLEWKTYEHDALPNLATVLVSYGFTPEPVESVLVCTNRVTGQEALAADRRIGIVSSGDEDLSDVAEILRATGRSNVDKEIEHLREQLRNCRIFIHIAYIDGVPVSCGRLHYGSTPGFAELAGGRSKPDFRRRGLYTDLVKSRLTQSFSAERHHVYVDALPTSAPILQRLGFAVVTKTRPYVYVSSNGDSKPVLP